MEHVLNANARHQAFYKFLFLFVITVAIIVIAVYFDTAIPQKENMALREQVRKYEQEFFNEQQYLSKADSIKGLIDSLEHSSSNYDFNNSFIADNLVRMQSMAYSFDSNSLYATINKKLFFTMANYHEEKKRAENIQKAMELSRQSADEQIRNAPLLRNSNADF